MKKINKLFLAAGSLAAVAAPIATVVSCGASAGTKTAMGIELKVSRNAEMWFVADGGSVQDKAFNEAGLAGVAQFGNENHKTYNYYQPAGSDLTSGYQLADRNGADVVVGTGFAHGDAFGEKGLIAGSAASYFNAGDKPAFIGLDASFTKGTAAQVNRLVSVQYNTQYAGFLAGMYAMEYVNGHKSEFTASNGKYQLATFGGAGYPTVTSWMDGFRMAVETDKTNFEMVYVGGTPSKLDFSGGFGVDNAGKGPQATTIAEKLLEKGADVIFPVAGPQIQLVVKAIQRKQTTTKVIGVDGDQKAAYGYDEIIGSALKHLQKDILAALDAYYKGGDAWKAYAGHIKTGQIGFVYGDNSQDFTVPNYEATVDAIATADAHKFDSIDGTSTGKWSKIQDQEIKLSY